MKATLNEIKNLTNNQNFLIDDPYMGYPVTPCMDVHKEKIQYDESIDKLKLIIVFIWDLQNKEMIGDNWDPIESMSTLKYLLVDAYKHKERLQKLDFIWEFLEANVKHRVLWSWAVDMVNTSQIMPTILEDYWGWTNKCMEWLIKESYLMMNLPIGW